MSRRFWLFRRSLTAFNALVSLPSHERAKSEIAHKRKSIIREWRIELDCELTIAKFLPYERFFFKETTFTEEASVKRGKRL